MTAENTPLRRFFRRPIFADVIPTAFFPAAGPLATFLFAAGGAFVMDESKPPHTRMQRRFDEYVWEELIAYTLERQVVPVVGPQLLRSQTGEPFETLLALPLARELGLDFPRDSILTLNDVACRYRARQQQRQGIFPRLLAVLRNQTLVPPPSLKQLACIRDVALFLTTTFDGVLGEAVAESRDDVLQLSYAPNRIIDIPNEIEAAEASIVYHLLGKLSATPSCVLSDEDLLEFMSALHTRSYQPERLFSRLESSHLVLLGTGLPDWLCRLLLRLVKRQRLSQERDLMEIIVDQNVSATEGLGQFLEHFSSRTFIYPGSAEEFIAEWHTRWSRASVACGDRVDDPRASSSAATAAGRVVFISYAREDLERVRRLSAILKDAGVPAWFDVQQLEAGDAYELKIRKSIAECALFIPIISEHTQRRLRGWFRREWSYAAEQAREFADDYPFILPLLLDDIPERELIVPERFKQAHIVRTTGGEPPAEFIARVANLVKQ